jgi:hypothetical protein
VISVKFKQLICRQDVSDIHGKRMTGDEIRAEAARTREAIRAKRVQSIGGVVLAGETI